VARIAIDIPLPSGPLVAQRDWIERAHDMGYSDLWSSESVVMDDFTPLAAAAAWNEEVRLGTASVPVYTRGPGLLAMTQRAWRASHPGASYSASARALPPSRPRGL
jgi:alkanesulfonate monooxygenase SsuD/methylene tetrahydromethanopterin reductase-like flavin-dependent oxidoreductase (luciferase family)